jgi:hypothetical protein
LLGFKNIPDRISGIQYTGIIYKFSLLLFIYSIYTQVCEQLNAWLGGYQSILKHMTPGNFNWFLHAMLFYHTKYVIQKQTIKKPLEEYNEEEEDLGLDEENDEDEDE